MKLQEFMDRFKERDLQEWARIFNISRKTLWNLLQGKGATLEIALYIEMRTAGFVTGADLLEDGNKKTQKKSNKQQQNDDTSTNAPVGLDNVG